MFLINNVVRIKNEKQRTNYYTAKRIHKKMENAAVKFIDSIDKSQIETILLSGSVARGDFFPEKKENGEYEGMIDLIVMKKDGSSITAEELFGKNQDPEIPYHCIKVEGI